MSKRTDHPAQPVHRFWSALREAAHRFWRARGTRERFVLTALAATLAILLAAATVQALQDIQLRTLAQLSRERTQLERMREASAQIARLDAGSRTFDAGKAAHALDKATLGASLKSRGLDLSVSLVGDGGVTIQGRAPVDVLLGWLADLSRDVPARVVSLDAQRMQTVGDGSAQVNILIEPIAPASGTVR
jgi:type II secretory pathway component PulM